MYHITNNAIINVSVYDVKGILGIISSISTKPVENLWIVTKSYASYQIHMGKYCS